MNKLITSDITAGSRMPIKKGTIDFLQLAYQEPINALAQRIIGTNYDPTKAYVLYGLTGSSGNITAGALFFNGEVYLCDGDSSGLPCGGSNVSVLNIAITNYSSDADPVTFSDGSIYDIHNIRKVAISCGASGSGDVCDYTDLVRGTINQTIDTSTFSVGWQAVPTVPLTYTIDTNGFIHWQGRIESNSGGTASGTIWSAGGMPTEARPTVFSINHICMSTAGGGTLGGLANTFVSWIEVRADGRLVILSSIPSFGTAGDYIDITGLSYKVA